MLYVIKDISVFDELDKIEHDIKTSTFYSAKRGNGIGLKSYLQICKRVGRQVEAIQIEKVVGFTIDLFITDHDLKKKIHKEIFAQNPEQARKNAIAYLSDPDNLYDIYRQDEQVLPNNPEINEDRNETIEGKLQDSSG